MLHFLYVCEKATFYIVYVLRTVALQAPCLLLLPLGK